MLIPSSDLFDHFSELATLLRFDPNPHEFSINLRIQLIKTIERDFKDISQSEALLEEMRRLHFFIRDTLGQRSLEFIEKKQQSPTELFTPLKEASYHALIKYICSGNYNEHADHKSQADLKAFREEFVGGFSRYSKPSRDPYQITLVRKLSELVSLLEGSKLFKTTPSQRTRWT